MISFTPSNSNSEKVENAPLVNEFSEFTIGSLLLRMGKITPEDAERIMRLHKEKGLRFGEAAQALGLITEDDIQQVLSRQFNYPYLSPDQNSYLNELVAAYQPFSNKAEVLRAVRSQLMLHWFSPERKALAVSSVSSSDNASSFVANLAVVFAQLGENTLLIDANLRYPRQHEIYNLSNKRGLSDILAGRAGYDVISKINFFENLSVLTAGTLPPNPQELVSKPTFGNLIKELACVYDVILLDTPELSNYSDGYAIAFTVGGIVLVARQNHTRVNDLSIAVEQCKNNGTKVIGSILVDL
ncbi:chain length determinant protein tyrosine kinase EpsG [Methylobacillus flagellatus]|uniref:Protein-tyrosine kinase n=1 Tax=Methylobacillus flagellatus (strain ATCC 51484 / DSM 6875 / VKM B-1610 / KT) TaxID=265072 RepID=Q1GZP6_METFK|nr:chain length determinant protein tyrosine kinase EpsG [Methylobacillus flagellatus]ABE50291.1 Protein-tyrosine kinase [Methylobacillus flagellatus KT]